MTQSRCADVILDRFPVGPVPHASVFAISVTSSIRALIVRDVGNYVVVAVPIGTPFSYRIIYLHAVSAASVIGSIHFGFSNRSVECGVKTFFSGVALDFHYLKARAKKLTNRNPNPTLIPSARYYRATWNADAVR